MNISASTQALPPKADLLNDVLEALHVDSSMLYLFDFSGPWAFEVDDVPLSFSWTIVEGSVSLVAPRAEPIVLHRGDTFLFPRGIGKSTYSVYSSKDVKPMRADELFRRTQIQTFQPGSRPPRSARAVWGRGDDLTRVVSAAFTFNDRKLGPLIEALPELMIMRASKTGHEFIDVLLRIPLGEEGAEQPGYSALATQTVRLFLIHAVRTYALAIGGAGFGWLAGLGDTCIARALVCIHREPEFDWTVADLARTAGLSRSIFAERFAARVGQTPMQYLRAWRMHLAREALASGNATVSTLAQDLGYRSEAAFRTAFCRATGERPRDFQRHARSQQRS